MIYTFKRLLQIRLYFCVCVCILVIDEYAFCLHLEAAQRSSISRIHHFALALAPKAMVHYSKWALQVKQHWNICTLSRPKIHSKLFISLQQKLQSVTSRHNGVLTTISIAILSANCLIDQKILSFSKHNERWIGFESPTTWARTHYIILKLVFDAILVSCTLVEWESRKIESSCLVLFAISREKLWFQRILEETESKSNNVMQWTLYFILTDFHFNTMAQRYFVSISLKLCLKTIHTNSHGNHCNRT